MSNHYSTTSVTSAPRTVQRLEYGSKIVSKDEINSTMDGKVEVKQHLEDPMEDHVSHRGGQMMPQLFYRHDNPYQMTRCVQNEKYHRNSKEKLRSLFLQLGSASGFVGRRVQEPGSPLESAARGQADGHVEGGHEDDGDEESEDRVRVGHRHHEGLELHQADALPLAGVDHDACRPDAEAVDEEGEDDDDDDDARSSRGVAPHLDVPGQRHADVVLERDADDEPDGQEAADVAHVDGDLADDLCVEGGNVHLVQPDDKQREEETYVRETLRG